MAKKTKVLKEVERVEFTGVDFETPKKSSKKKGK